MVSVLAIDHEIDGKKNHGADVCQLARPAADRKKQVFGKVRHETLQPGIDAREVEVRGKAPIYAGGPIIEDHGLAVR